MKVKGNIRQVYYIRDYVYRLIIVFPSRLLFSYFSYVINLINAFALPFPIHILFIAQANYLANGDV